MFILDLAQFLFLRCRLKGVDVLNDVLRPRTDILHYCSVVTEADASRRVQYKRVRNCCWWIRLSTLLVSLAILAQAALSSNSGQKHLDQSRCTGLPPEKQVWLPEAWHPFQKFVKICPITSGNSPVLYVMSIWADDYYKTRPADEPSVKFPKPLLLLPTGKTVGELPFLFPRDPPRVIEPVFTQWHNDFPHEIELWLQDPTVMGDHYLPPLVWDGTSARFVRKAETKAR